MRVIKIEKSTPTKAKLPTTIKTPSNSRTLRQLQLTALERPLIKQDPVPTQLIQKLGNSALGNYVETFLERSRADSLQKILNDSATARKNNPRSRNQITSQQAITGRELLLMDLTYVKPAASTKKPRAARSKPTSAVSKTVSKAAKTAPRNKGSKAKPSSSTRVKQTPVVVDLEGGSAASASEQEEDNRSEASSSSDTSTTPHT